MTNIDELFTSSHDASVQKEAELSRLKRRIEETPLHLSEEKFPESLVRDDEYVTQLAESGGLHTCLPTSIINAFLHQGYISPEQAHAVQHHLVTNREDLFTQGQIGGRTISLYTGSAVHISRIASEVSPITPAFDVLPLSELTQDEVEKLLLMQIEEGSVVVTGDNEHARLIVGYTEHGHTVAMRDPMHPFRITSMPLQEAATQVRTSFIPYITVVPKPPQDQPNG